MVRFQLWDCVATTDSSGETLILLYGRTSREHGDVSICLRLSGLYHFVYIPQPLQTLASSSPVDALERALGRRSGSVFVGAESVTRTDVNGFHVAEPFWKLWLRDHRQVYQLRELVNKGDVAVNFSRKSYLTDFPTASLAQIELGLANCGWAEVDDALLSQQCVYRMSSCKLEYAIVLKTAVANNYSVKPVDEREWPLIPSRFRVASLDIECAGRRGVFPDPLHDPIIQIATFIVVHGENQPLSFTIHTWRAADEADAFEAGGFRATYVLCLDESDMIEKWVRLMRQHDVDLYIGWNSDDFDLPYIVRRASALTRRADVSGLGRRLNANVTAEPTRFSSKQLGTRESYELKGVEGVHFLDECIEVMRSRKERSYKLDHIARTVLALKNSYNLLLVDSLWLARAVSVQVLGLGAKSSGLSTCPLIFKGDDVFDRSVHKLVAPPLKAGFYRITLSRQNKAPYLFLRFFDDAQRCVGFVCCGRASDQHKDDVHYTQITELWNGSDADRRTLALYNLMDALLPWQIMCELRTLGTLIEMARVSKTDITKQMQRGQNVKSTMLLQWEAHRAGFIVPYLPPRIKERMGNCESVPEWLWCRHDLDAAAKARSSNSNGNGDSAADADAADADAFSEPWSVDDADSAAATPSLEAGKGKTKYTGGYVGKMEPRFYGPEEPVHTVDFESLYPSLMMTHNLCPTTLVTSDNKAQLAKAGLVLKRDCVQSPIKGVYFVRHEVRRGLLPAILDQILTARRVAKKALAAATDLGERSSLDGRQLALKVTANSVYGFTGAAQSTLPCLYVAASVTTYGKEAILFSKETVEREWPGCSVIYIDTDSLFVRNPACKTVAAAIACGLAQSKRVTELFNARSTHNRLVLAFEKVNCPFLGMAPKRYASLYWTRVEDPDMVYERGVETVRRDVPLLVSETMAAAFFLILWCGDVEAACEVIRLVVSQLWMCEVPMEKLVMAKEYKKEFYANAQPHVHVVNKMKRRDASTAPKIGDRVPYVVVPHDKKTVNVSDAAESPDYCLKNDIYPDQAWYVDQLETCLARVMNLVVGPEATRQLFHGAHTLRRHTILPKSGGLFNFIKRGADAVAALNLEQVADAGAADGGAGAEEVQQKQQPQKTVPPNVPKAAKSAKSAKSAKRAKKATSVPANGGIAAFFVKK
jgi:DNA polymerase elongation subunit (family B)